MTAVTPTKEKKATFEQLQELDREIADLGAKQQAAWNRLASSEQELTGLVSMGKSLEVRLSMLTESHQRASAEVAEAQAAAARNYGLPTEQMSIKQLLEAEAKMEAVSTALTQFNDAGQITTNQERVKALRGLIKEDKATLAHCEQRFPQMQQERRVLVSHIGKEATLHLLRNVADFLAILELEGPIIKQLVNDSPQEFNALLWNVAIDQYQLLELMTPCESPDGKSSDFRPSLKDRQFDIRQQIERLKKL